MRSISILLAGISCLATVPAYAEEGGTLATTSEPVSKMMADMFEPVGAQFRAMANI